MENKKKNTLLLVDDSESNLELLSEIFSDSYELITAKDGVQALEIMTENPGRINAVLLDISIPGMDGYQVLEMMNGDDRLKFIPVIILTDKSDPDAEQKAFQLGAADFIVRPFNAQCAVQRVRNALRKQELDAVQMENDVLKKEAYTEKQLSALLDNLRGGISLSERDNDGIFRTLYCSRGLAEIFGYPDYESYKADVDKDPFGHIYEEDRIRLREKIAKAEKTGVPVEYALRCSTYNGSPIWIMIKSQLSKGSDGKLRLYNFISDITKEKEYEKELTISAFQDPLTGLNNREAFFNKAKKLLSKNPDVDYSILRFNIGRFKLINDMLGRSAGDGVLIAMAAALEKITPKNGICARFFSDNFAMLLPSHRVDGDAIIAEIKAEVDKVDVAVHDVWYYVGVYRIKDRSLSVEDMSDRANVACRSINGNYNRHCAYYDETMLKAMLEEQEIQDETQKAIENQEFCIYYQPVYGIKANRFVSAEALVRWKHPTKGMIPPGKFIPIFERNGFIVDLDFYVLEHVCMYQKKRRECGLEPFPISVNISRMSLYNPKLFDVINGLAEKYGVEPSYFRIEITESAYNDNPAQLLETVNKLREKGFPVLMDDFGSGYSSLNTLKDIPVDLLKLDMKFMQGFEENERVGTIVTSVARMSKWLNIPLLAEGVETKEQYLFLKSIGCSYIQGFYFSRPVPESEYTVLIGQGMVPPTTFSLASDGMGDELNMILGGNALVSKLISGVFGGLGIYEMNGDNLDIIRVNDGYTQILGYSSEDFADGTCKICERIYPDDVDVFLNACREAAATDKSVRVTVRRYNKNGDLLFLDGIHKRLGGTDENPILCIAFNDITDQIAKNKLIEQSQHRIQTILDATGSVVVDWDIIGNKFFCSGKVEEYGLSAKALSEAIKTKGGFRSIVHPDDYERLVKFHYDTFQGCSSGDFRVKKSDGNYHWLNFTENRIYDAGGKLVHVMGVCNDIDAERTASLALAQTKELMDITMKNINAGVLMLEAAPDGSTRMLYSNQRLWSLIGIEPDENADFIGILSSRVHPDDSERIEKFLNSAAEKRSIDIRVRGNNDEWNWISVSVSRVENTDHYCMVVTDISDLKSVTSQLETLINSAPCGIALFEIKGECDMIPLYLSNSFYDSVGFDRTRNESGDYDIYKSVHPEDVEHLKKAVRKGGTIHAQFRTVRDGGVAWLELTAVPTDSYSDKKRLYMVILIDITKQKLTALKLEFIMDNFDGGIALIDRIGETAELSYANDKFYHMLDLSDDDEVLNRTLTDLIPPRKNDPAHDIEITVADSLGKDHLISAHTVKIKRGEMSGNSYIALLTDVTAKRAAELRRTMERYASTLCGFYDEVFEVNYRDMTTRLLSSKRHPERTVNANPVDLNQVLKTWGDRFIHPADKRDAMKFFASPVRNKDISDAYVEYRTMDFETDGKYKLMSSSLINVEGDIYMLFNKDITRFEKIGDMEQRNKLLAEKLEESSRYELVAELTNTTVIERDLRTGRIFCSQSFDNFAASRLDSSVFRNEDEYIKGQTVHPDDKPVIKEFIKRLRNGDPGSGIVLRMEMIGGDYKWCRLCVSYIKDEHGENSKSLCTINIVDEEIKAKKNLEKSNEILNRTVKNIPMGVGIFGIRESKPYSVYISDNAYKILGIKDIADSMKLSSYFEEGKTFRPGEEDEVTFIHTKPDGTQFWLNAKYQVVEENGDILIYTTIDDVSEKMELKRRRAAQEQIYQMMLDESGTTIFDYNTETDAFCYYPLAKTGERKPIIITGLSSDPDKLNFFRPSDRKTFMSILEKLSESADAEELTLKMLIDGKSRWCRSYFKSISDSSGKVFRIVGKIDDIDEEMSHIDQIRAKAMYDSLCVDIYNKATTEELIRAELEQNARGALMMIDVDDFKSINDRLGHLFGDEFLKKLATTIKSIFRENDIVGRYGGDEFFVFLNHTGASLAEKKAKMILERISSVEVPEIGSVKSSIGIAVVTPDNRDYRRLIKQADSALYQAKNRGKSCVVLFDPDNMDETSYRVQDANSGRNPVLSSNPHTESSLIMRVFSTLYSSSNLKNGINQMLSLVGKTFDVSRAYIFENSEDNLYCSNTFEWCNEGVTSEMDSLQNLSYKDDLCDYYRNNINEDGIFYCHDISSLSGKQREILERQDIKSVLQCAIMDKDVFRGFVGFDECRSNRFWTQDQIDALTFISKILTVFLLNERSRKLTENYAHSIESILDYYPAFVYIVDPDSCAVVYMNQMTKKLFSGKAQGEIICGSKDYPGLPIAGLEKEGTDLPLDIVSRFSKDAAEVLANSIEWHAKQMYLVTVPMTKNPAAGGQSDN